jgi:integrase
VSLPCHCPPSLLKNLGTGNVATIYKRLTEDGKVRYTAYIRLKGHPRQSQTFDRKADAVRWAKQHETAVQTGRYLISQEASKRTLADLINRYTEQVLPDLPDSARDYARHLRWWREQLGSYYLSDITPRMIDDCKHKLLRQPGPRGKRSNSTVNRYLTTLSAAYTYGMSPAVSWVTQHVVRTVGRKEEPRGRVRFLSRPVDEQDSELERLLAACKQNRNPDLYDLVVLALYTGMRQGELMAIRRSWIRLDMDSPGISLPAMATKGNEDRFVPLVGEALSLIKVRLSIASDYLFSRTHPGKKPTFPRKSWERALLVARIADFRFHDLRHSHASYLAMHGSTEREIMGALGHKSTAMAARYAHIANTHKVKVAQRLTGTLGYSVQAQD